MSQATDPAPSWHPPFFGDGLTRDDYETIAIQHIPRKLRESEPELFTLRWFDAREFHPVKATYWLAECYNQAVRDHVATIRDRTRAPFSRAFRGDDVFESRERLSFWRLRQLIDRLGIRYEFFMRYAMNWCRENGWIHTPRPGHIAANEDLVADVVLRWEEVCSQSIQFCKNPRFLACNYRGDPDQVAYERYLLCEIAKKQHPRFSLNAALFIEKVLREGAAEAALGAGLVEQARELCI